MTAPSNAVTGRVNGCSSGGAPFRVFITTTCTPTADRPWSLTNYRIVHRSAEIAASQDFAITYSPEEADAVLFIDCADRFGADILSSTIYKRYKQKSFVFSAMDDAIPFMPGIYTDLRGPVAPGQPYFGGFYIKCAENKMLLSRQDLDHPVEYLFSFVGNVRNNPGVRSKIVQIKHPRGLVKDRSSGMRDDDLDFIRTLRSSSFVICPPGFGPTSWRVYEAMMAGRVPVMVSDRWVPAPGIPWHEFSVRVSESSITAIPDILQDLEPRARGMGRRAREVWDQNFSVEGAFGWLARQLRELAQFEDLHAFRTFAARWRALRQADAMREYARYFLRRMLRG